MGSLPVVVPANLESPTSTPLNRDAVSFHKQLDSSGRLLISDHPASDAWSLLNGSQTPNCVLVGFEICVSDSDIRRDSSSNFSETEYTFEIMAVAVKQGVTVKPNDVLTLDYGSEYTVGAQGLPVSGRQPGAYDVQVEALSSINSRRLRGFAERLTAAAVILYGCAVSPDGAALQKDVLARASDRNSGRRDYSTVGLRSCCLSTRLNPFRDVSAGDLPPGWRFSIAVAVSRSRFSVLHNNCQLTTRDQNAQDALNRRRWTAPQ